MSFWKQLMTATTNAYGSFINTYRYPDLVPVLVPQSALASEAWESYVARQFRYAHYDHYYFNTAFTLLEAYKEQHLQERGLYKYTRGLYNPVFRLVELYVGKCYGGALDWKDMRTGAVPLDDANNRIVTAIRQLWKWSNFAETKSLYPRTAARFGDGVIKIVDDPARGKVWLEFLHPGLVREAEIDAVGHVKSIVIEYEMLDDTVDPPKPFLYREIIDRDHFATYRVAHGKQIPLARYTDADGNPVTAWDNPYGFVPVAWARAKHLGRKWGAVPYVGGVLDKIDQVNDLASLTADQIRKTVNVDWHFSGSVTFKELKSDSNPRSSMRAFIGEAGSKAPTPMVANLDVSGALKKVEMLLDEIERDLPELAFHRLREYAANSAPAVMTVLGDAVDRLGEVRGNLDAPLLRAFQMAISIGGVRGYEGFEPFGLDDYARGNLDFQIAPRPIVKDQLSKRERIELLIQSNAPSELVWQELDVSEQDILRGTQAATDRDMRAAGEVAQILAAIGSESQDGDTADQRGNGNGTRA